MTSSFGHYKILAEIGRGGMGIVYQALDRRDKSLVAIKQLVLTNIDLTKEKEFRDRFKREAATAARLHHPNIVDVFDVYTDRENYFYVMEYLEGHSLRRELELKGGRMTARDYWPILKQVTDGLSFAHSMNVVHRDVKPDNIFLLSDGRVKLTDFGIARAVDYEQTNLTKTGVMMGTLAYVSPEQLQDAKNVDNRADIFSLGVVTYESISGTLPFTADGIAQTIVKIVSQEEKPLHIVWPQINLHTSATVTKALRKRARERYRSVMDFAKEFQASLDDFQDPKVTSNIAQAHEKFGIRTTENQPPFPSEHNEASTQHNTESDSSGENPEITQLRARAIDHGVDTSANFFSETTSAQAQAPAPVPVTLSNSLSKAPTGEVKFTASTASTGKQELANQKPIGMFDSYGKDKQQLKEPGVLCFRSGRLAVGDIATRQVHLFSYDGRWIGNLVVRPSSESKTAGGALTKPSGIAVDDKGRVYVTDSSDPYVRIFDSRGVFFKEFCNIQGKDGGIQGIAIDSTGLIYLSDAANGCIQVFQAELGLWMRSIGVKGQSDKEFQLPSGLTTDRLNQIYCVDYGSSRIYVFNKSGSFVRSFGGKGTGPGLFNVPRSVAVDSNDKIYVLDSLNHRIQVFGPTGDYFYSFGGKGSEPGKFRAPADFSIDASNHVLYVADKGNQRIQVFELSNK